MPVSGRVRLLSDGRFVYRGSYMTGQVREMGRTAVVEVAGDGAEYWAKTEPGVFALVKAAAAIVTRRPPDIGENRSVAL